MSPKLAKIQPFKVGARHSRADVAAIQDMHDYAVKLGASCGESEFGKAAKVYDPDTLISYGDPVIKSLGDGLIGGYLVRFSTENDPDLTGDFFTAKTDFGDMDKSLAFYHHGLDETLGRQRLKNAAQIGQDEVGVWIKHQLDLRNDYEKAINQLAEDKKLGWSSGTASHLVDRVPTRKAVWIKSWPLGLDASYTPTPAEPRNTAIVSLKTLLAQPDNPQGGSTAGQLKRVFPFTPKRITQ